MNDRAVAWAKARAAELVTGIDDATRNELKDLIAEGLEDNIGMDAIADNIRDAYAFSADRAELIARNEVAMANQAGALEGMKAAKGAGVKLKKVWVPDADACPICEENGDDGPIDLDDQFSSGDDAPTAHPNCFLAGTSVTAFGVTKAYKRWFQGKIIVLTIAGDVHISVTPNHPILTRRGWLAAADLKVGDLLAQSGVPVNAPSAVNPDNHYIETRIEEIADSLIMSGSSSTTTVPTTTEHFHGDGISNGEVDIVGPTSSLHSNYAGYTGDAEQTLEEKGNTDFSDCQRQRILLASKSTLTKFIEGSLASPHGDMSSSHTSLADSRINSTGLHSASVAMAPNGKAEQIESFSKRTGFAPHSLSNIDTAFTSHIRFVELADLVVTEFSGHVYNLQTVDGWYVAESIIVSNCECSLASEVEDEEGNETEEDE